MPLKDRPTVRAMLFCASLVVLSPAALAERADREKPINVEADAMQYDDLKQVNVFTGNVTLTKGTILIRGDRLVLRQDPEGYQYATAEGRPASFRQKRDGGVDQFIAGVAQRLTYDGRTEKVRLEEQANLKRLERERVTDEIHGKVITYDSRNEFFNVEGGGASASSPENPTGRVRVVIQPRDAQPESPAPGTLTPARSLGTPAK